MINKYLIEALDNYPYDLTKAAECIDYALAANPNCPHALLLQGRMYAEQFGQADVALEYYLDALAQDVNQPLIYPYYASALIRLSRYEEALKAIDFALTIPGCYKVWMLRFKIDCYELMGEWEKAIQTTKEAIKWCCNDETINELKDGKNRINKKMGNKQTRKKKKSKKRKKIA